MLRSVIGCSVMLAAAHSPAAVFAPAETPAPQVNSTAVASGAASSMAAAPHVGKIQPLPRTDRNSQRAHEDLVRKATQGGIDLYFAGDSITRRWGTCDAQYKDFLANWTTNFFGWNAGNFGWGGDKVQNVLWRLQNGELDGVHPKVMVLLAGTNDLDDGAATTDLAAREEDVVQGIGAILNLMREQAPGATIILMGITPREDRADRLAMAAAIDRTNRRLAQLADGRTIRYLNLNDRLTTPDGRLREGVTVDGLHLSLSGYQVWADALKPLLTELLGPPAKTDHAPPPTGDPSAPKPAAPAK